jgi:hypothetical protein
MLPLMRLQTATKTTMLELAATVGLLAVQLQEGAEEA